MLGTSHNYKYSAGQGYDQQENENTGGAGAVVDWRVICLHRIRGSEPITPAHSAQVGLGLSISVDDLGERIAGLRAEGAELVLTIDDGHRDAFALLPFLDEWDVSPILFLTAGQLQGETRTLPFTAFCAWCAKQGIDPDNAQEELSFNRHSLRALRQGEKEALFASVGIPLDPPEERCLSKADIRVLMSAGFRVGYHGPEHSDLRLLVGSAGKADGAGLLDAASEVAGLDSADAASERLSSAELGELFRSDFRHLAGMALGWSFMHGGGHPREAFFKRGYVPYFAWPLGLWNNELSDLAYNAGFHIQFGLNSERLRNGHQIIYKREIWN